MAIDAVGSSTSLATRNNTMGVQEFMKILLTQLTYQDPLKPMDNKEFMAQIAQFTTLEQTQQLNEKIAMLITNQAALQSVGLIGKSVDVSTGSGPVSGTVVSLSLAGSAPTVSVQTTAGPTLDGISLSQLTSIR